MVGRGSGLGHACRSGGGRRAGIARGPAIRVSPGLFTTEQDVDALVAALRADAAGGRSRGMRCVIDNGYTRPGTYTGAVTATIG